MANEVVLSARTNEQVTAGRPTVGGTTAEGATAASALIAQQAGVLRSQVDALGADAAIIHHEVRDYDLAQRAAVKGRRSVSDLLIELATERGLAWADIARLVGVSVAAIRKWRAGGPSSAEHRLSLAGLAAFLDLLEEYAIADPAQWMEIPLPLSPEYSITPIDIYQQGCYGLLLEYASQRRTATEIMDGVNPSWRDARSDYEVYDAPDGMKALRPR